MPCPPPLRPPRYQLRELLGKGSYGSVYRAAHADTGKEYAVKLLRVSSTGHARHPPSSSPPLSSHYDRVCVLNELRVLAAHECPFLVAFKEAYVHEGSLHIVTEWAQRGDLAHLLRARKGQLLRAPQVWHLFLPLCVAVDYLHQIRVLHRDLKPANVLVDAAGHVKLADLGIVKVMRGFGGNEMLAQTQIGTPCYMSPEVFKRERYGPSADVWSLGCVLHELLTLRPAFVAPNLPALRERVLRGGPVLPASTEDAATQPLVALCRDLLRVHPRARPTLPTLLARPAVRQELCARGLEALRCEAVVKPLFHTPCAVPRSLEEWTKVASLFGQLHATIRLEATDEAKLEAVDQLRDQLDARRRPLTRSLLTPPHPHPPPHPRPSPAHRRPVLFPVPSPNLPRPPHFQLVRMHAAAISRLRSARAEVTRLETLVEDLRKQLGVRRKKAQKKRHTEGIKSFCQTTHLPNALPALPLASARSASPWEDPAGRLVVPFRRPAAGRRHPAPCLRGVTGGDDDDEPSTAAVCRLPHHPRPPARPAPRRGRPLVRAQGHRPVAPLTPHVPRHGASPGPPPPHAQSRAARRHRGDRGGRRGGVKETTKGHKHLLTTAARPGTAATPWASARPRRWPRSGGGGVRA